MAEFFSQLALAEAADWQVDGDGYQISLAAGPAPVFLCASRGPHGGWRLSLQFDTFRLGYSGDGHAIHLKRQRLFMWWIANDELPPPPVAFALGCRLVRAQPTTFRHGDARHLADAVQLLLGESPWPCLHAAVVDHPPSWSFARDLPEELQRDLEAVARWAWPEGWVIDQAGSADGTSFFAPLPRDVRLRGAKDEVRAGWSAHERLEYGLRLRAVADGIRASRPEAARRLDAAA